MCSIALAPLKHSEVGLQWPHSMLKQTNKTTLFSFSHQDTNDCCNRAGQALETTKKPPLMDSLKAKEEKPLIGKG